MATTVFDDRWGNWSPHMPSHCELTAWHNHECKVHNQAVLYSRIISPLAIWPYLGAIFCDEERFHVNRSARQCKHKVRSYCRSYCRSCPYGSGRITRVVPSAHDLDGIEYTVTASSYDTSAFEHGNTNNQVIVLFLLACFSFRSASSQ